MKATLANFGDAIRVVQNVSKDNVVIGIGKIVVTDIHPAHYDFIFKAQLKGDTLLLVPDGTTEVPTQLTEVLQLLSEIDSGPYDEIISRLAKLLGADNIDMRPTKPQIRYQLKEVAAGFCKANAEMLANALTASRTERAPAPQLTEPADPALRASLGLSERPPAERRPRERVRLAEAPAPVRRPPPPKPAPKPAAKATKKRVPAKKAGGRGRR